MKPQDIRDAFFEEMLLLAQKDPNVIFLTADMGAFALEHFKKELPERYINMGVAEQNMISVAAGLALSGKKVFVHSIIPFVTARCYEQIKIDLCCMKLPVVIVGIGAGLTYAGDGPTHHGINDIALMRSLPNMTIFSPSDAPSTRAACRMAYRDHNPVYVRLEKGVLPEVYDEHHDDFALGFKMLREGRDVTILSSSFMTHQACAAADILQERGFSVMIIDVLRLKPLNIDAVEPILRNSRLLVTVEEHSLVGGLGSLIAECLADRDIAVPLRRLGIGDAHCFEPLSRGELQAIYGLSVGDIVKVVEEAKTKFKE